MTSARRNTVWAAVDFLVTPVGMLLVIPKLLESLGLEQFGVLVLANTLIAFSSLFNFGFGDTALRYVSHYMGQNNRSAAADMARTIGALALASAALVAILFWFTVPWAAAVLRVGHLSYAVASLHVISVTMGLRMIESVYVAVIRGAYRYDLAAYVTVVAKTAVIGSQAVLAAYGFGIVEILQAIAACVLLSSMALFVVASTQLGNVVPRYSRIVFAEIRDFSGWSWLQGLGGLVYANTDRLVVTAFLGPSALAIYGVCIQLAQNIHFGLSAMAHSFFPTVSMLKASSDDGSAAVRDRLRAVYLRVSRLLTVTAVATGCALAVFARDILDIWVGPDVAQRGATALAVLAVSFGWFAANSISTYYTLNGIGRAKLQASASLVSAGLMFVSSMLLVPLLGLFGAAAVRLPDTLYRMGLRIYVGSSVVGAVRWWAALDFIRTALVCGPALLLLRAGMYRLVEADNVLRTPAVVVVAAGAAGLWWLALQIENRLGRRAVALESRGGEAQA